ncbi:4-oxalocrotonate tautomerase [Paraburkholderia sp. C35]|uniref:tautomerase family protein n=1 Tax=Paraburkholderia sp. C35 TaxID=2126993 RepID=UPI000D69021E|nr:4-oxalocrotonate tautomerase [Paraburkholderia sp. C35]
MPVMNVRYAVGSLDAASKAVLANRLTEVLIQMEGGANTPGGRDFAWVRFDESARDDFWIGGQSNVGAEIGPTFLVDVTIPEGYMNRTHKNEVHSWVASAISEATGHAASDVPLLTVITEVPEGNWSTRGVPISLETTAVVVGLPSDGERLRWSRKYFEAKARALAAADYPSDMGGLLPSMSGDVRKT